jgi:hypothetical protein
MYVFDDQHPGWLWFCTVPRIIMRSFICGNSRPTQFRIPSSHHERGYDKGRDEWVKNKEEHGSSFEFINNKEANSGTGWSGCSVCPSSLYRRE